MLFDVLYMVIPTLRVKTGIELGTTKKIEGLFNKRKRVRIPNGTIIQLLIIDTESQVFEPELAKPMDSQIRG